VNDTLQFLPSKADVALQNCFAQIRLARATELAESGRLLEAEAVLVQTGKLPDSANELDLLARIAARQGKFDQARQRWNAALQLKPDNEIYRRCLNELTPASRIVRLIVYHQDTLLIMLVWLAIAIGVASLVYTLRR
jgi:tetratricopeptide (TPR) repeat protein